MLKNHPTNMRKRLIPFADSCFVTGKPQSHIFTERGTKWRITWRVFVMASLEELTQFPRLIVIFAIIFVLIVWRSLNPDIFLIN
ncbi:hypothetical protein LINPERHAP2_LOCUS42430 [Linum perenne]